MNVDFVIIGGGCYGAYFVKQLDAARSRGKLDWSHAIVLDRDANCLVSRGDTQGVVVEVANWEEWGRQLGPRRATLQGAQLVPAPIAPHIMKHWLGSGLEEQGAVVTDLAYTGPVPALPFAMVLDRGTLVLSHAPGMCPTNCIEPRKCPLTKDTRSWDMPDTVAELLGAGGMDALEVFACRHFAYGVGTIAFSAIYAAYDRLGNWPNATRLGIATVSGCHGLVDVSEVVRES